MFKYLFRLLDPFVGVGDGDRLRFCLVDPALPTRFSSLPIGMSSSTDSLNLCTFLPPFSSTS